MGALRGPPVDGRHRAPGGLTVDTPDIDALASALLEARRARRRIALPVTRLADAEAAFAVQARVALGLGPAGAWKIGGGNPSASYSAAPIAAALVRPSPCRWPASDFNLIGIEAEIAFRIDRDLPVDPDEAAVRGAIASVHAVIEIVDSRYDVWPVPDRLLALADDQNNGGLVVEPVGRPWGGEPLERAHVTITADGATLFDQEGANPGGDPFALLLRLAGHAGRHAGGLKAGAYVTTGSLNGIHFVRPGAAVTVTVGGLGRVELTLPV